MYRTYQNFFNEDCRNISRRMVKYDVVKNYEIEKEQLKQLLALIIGRVCLTSDCWTTYTNISYIFLTTYYVDKD